jgi:hypothetical protein
MTLFNICTRVDYQENGEPKRKWFRVGFFRISSTGKMQMRLFQQPDTTFYVFDTEVKLPANEPEENTQEE